MKPIRSDPEGLTYLDGRRIARWLAWHAMLAATPWFLDWRPALLMMVLGAFTMGFGLTVGIHRGLIHRAFRTGPWTERVLVAIGTLCGLGGPLGMSRMHHYRDYYQNQPSCPPYFGYQQGLLAAMGYALFCRFEPTRDPGVTPVWPEVLADPVLGAIERYGLWLQLPIALAFYAAFGWAGVVWSVGVRLALTQDGFWFIHYVSHTLGRQPFEIAGAAEQGRNAAWLALPSLGESWHNNHHAYPQSARMGLTAAQLDPGYWLILLLGAVGLAREIVVPPSLPLRDRARLRQVD
jgi:stearoyl-CoA desaturase (delta-9 desaturase)